MTNMIRFILREAAGLDIDAPEPKPIPWEGLYHPQAPDLFAMMAEYLDWYAPRVDVTIRVSGITRDSFPHCVELVDEPEEMNFVRKHTLAQVAAAGENPLYNRLTNRITYVRDDEGIGRYENFGEVTYKGGDLSLNWIINSSFKLKTSYTYLEARDEATDFWITAKPRHKIDGELYCTPMDHLTLVAGIDYTSAVYTRSDNSKQTPAYTFSTCGASIVSNNFLSSPRSKTWPTRTTAMWIILRDHRGRGWSE